MLRRLGVTQRIFIIITIFFVTNVLIIGIALAEDRNVIIGFHQSSIPTEEKLVKDNGGKLKKTFSVINAISANMSDENISKLRNDSRVEYIVNDSVFKAADEYANTWGVTYINSQPVHNQSINGTGIKIAVLDTGIDYYHEDLKNNYKGGYNFIGNNYDPWDDNCLSYYKTCHGTHVSGIIAAEHNDIGVVGVAPGASIYAVKILDVGGFGAASLVVAGIEWAINNNMDIISMSIESTENNTAVLDAVNVAYNSGILLIAAAGNTNGAVMYPAAYDSVIAVGAIDQNGQKATFSPTDPRIELVAPGVGINSTIQNGYGPLSGTSMSAPHVTGVAALMMSNGITDNKQVRTILQNTAKDIGTTGKDDIYGYGIVDAANAVGIPLPTPTPSPDPTPTPVLTYNLILKRVNSTPSSDAQRVNLTQGNYTINFHNVNLTEIDMKVYENGILKKRLSDDFEFNKKKNDIIINMIFQVPELTFSFIPYGKRGAIGNVNIKRV